MENLFSEFFAIEGVQGALYLTDEGSTVYSKFISPLTEKMNGNSIDTAISSKIDLAVLKSALEDTNESLIIFEKNRLYIKKTQNGYVIIVMGMFVPVAMVRLNCQIVIPELDKMKKQKGLGRFFKK